MIFDYVCFIAEWSILGTTHHRIVPNDRASRFLHWRRKRKLKPLMLAVSLALIHSVGSFTGIYSEKTLYKSAIVFERIPPSVESAKECKGTKEPSGCWWEMMHGARCTPDVLGQCIGIWCDPVEKTYIYIYISIYLLLYHSEVWWGLRFIHGLWKGLPVFKKLLDLSKQGNMPKAMMYVNVCWTLADSHS